MYKELEGLVVEERGNSTGAETGNTVWQPGKSVGTHFAEGLVGNFHLQKPRTWMDFVVSVFGHSVWLPCSSCCRCISRKPSICRNSRRRCWWRRLRRLHLRHRPRCMSCRECQNHFSRKASCLLRSSFPKRSRRSRRRLGLPRPLASPVVSLEECQAGNWAACWAASSEESVTRWRRRRLGPLPWPTKGPTGWAAKCKRHA